MLLYKFEHVGFPLSLQRVIIAQSEMTKIRRLLLVSSFTKGLKLSHIHTSPWISWAWPGKMVKNDGFQRKKSGLRLGDFALKRKLAGVFYIQSSASLIPFSSPMESLKTMSALPFGLLVHIDMAKFWPSHESWFEILIFLQAHAMLASAPESCLKIPKGNNKICHHPDVFLFSRISCLSNSEWNITVFDHMLNLSPH